MTMELLTYREAAAVLRVSDRTVYGLIRKGQLRCVRFGQSVRIDAIDLRAFIEKAKGEHDGQ